MEAYENKKDDNGLLTIEALSPNIKEVIKVKCKRCGRELTNPESIERGYGKKCWRIIQLQKEQELPAKVEDELKFLRMEIKMLKNQFKLLKANGIAHGESIERIKQDEHRPERDGNQVNMVVVIKELKIVLQQGVKLERVPEQFRNHKDIYENLELVH